MNISLKVDDTLFCPTGGGIHIIGSVEEPLFRAQDIGRELGLLNVHMSIESFPSYMKVEHFVQTNGGLQKCVYLTEPGRYW